MRRMLIACAVLALLPGCSYHEARPQQASVARAVEQAPLRLQTAPNFRDIGGYRTANGGRVKSGLAYRSDQMNRLSDADLQAIADLRPAAIVDLRTSSERTREPDRVPAGVQHIVLDVAADSVASFSGDMRQAWARIAQGEGPALLVSANREFVMLPSARRSNAELIRLLIASNGPVIYHCTAGKDRTGWATAIILSLLGVPRETVMADYMLSNERLAAKNKASIAALASMGSTVNPAYLEAALTVRPAYIQAAFDEVDRKFGTFDAYAVQALGLKQSEIKALRKKFVVSAS